MEKIINFPTGDIAPMVSTDPWGQRSVKDFTRKFKTLVVDKTPDDEAIWAMRLISYGDVRWHDGELIAWTGTHFAPALGLIRPFLQSVLMGHGVKGSSRVIESIVKAIDQKLNPVTPFDPLPWGSRRGVPFANGWYNLDTGALEPHNPENGNCWVSPVSYRSIDEIPPEDKAAVDQFFGSTFSDNPAKGNAVLAFIGYALSPDTKFEKSLFMVGRGRNGKGVLLSIVSALLGRAASSVDLVELSEDRFASSDIAGKQAALVYDLGRASLGGNTSIFKKMTSFEPLRAQRKQQQAFQFKNTAKLFVATNDLPHSKDVSAGFFARMLLVPFSQTFLGREDGGIKERLTSPRALSYVAALALIAYQEAVNAHQLPELPEGIAAMAEYRNGLDIMSAALSEDGCFERDDKKKMSAANAYEVFSNWASDVGIAHIPAKNTFSKKLADAGIVRIRDNSGRFFGLRSR